MIRHVLVLALLLGQIINTGPKRRIFPRVVVSGNVLTFNTGGGSSYNVPFLAGSAVGDFDVICTGQGGAFGSTPSGWTSVGVHGGSFNTGGCFYKFLISGDISTGFVTINFGSPDGGSYCIEDMKGISTGFREVDASYSSGFTTPVTETTSSSVLSTDISIYCGINDQSSISVGQSPPVITPGTFVASTVGTGVGSKSAAMNIASPSPAGATGVSFAYSGTGGPGAATYQAVIVITP